MYTTPRPNFTLLPKSEPALGLTSTSSVPWFGPVLWNIITVSLCFVMTNL